MSDHLSVQQLDRYRRRTLGPAEIIVAFEHAAICVACRERMAGRDQLRNAFVALGPDMYEAPSQEYPHLPPEQIAAYVDDEIAVADREIIDSHLVICTQCEAEVLALREIKDAISGSLSTPAAALTQAGLWARLVAFWSPSARRIPLQLATAAALLLIFLMATLPLRRQVAELRAQLTELQQKNDALQDQMSSISNLRTELAELSQSQAQVLDESARTAVALYDAGRLVTLDRQGNLAGLESLSGSSKLLVKTALSTQRVKAASVSDLIGSPEVLMGSSPGNFFSVLSPARAVLQTDRPTFRWTPLSGVSFYVVTVYDAGSNAVATSTQLSGTEWTVPRPLKRGGVYSWEVGATKDGREVVSPRPPAAQAKFKVLEQAMLDELDRAKHAYSDSHLVLGVLYAQAGLFEDAEREISALVNANPHSAVAQKLLTSVKSLRKR